MECGYVERRGTQITGTWRVGTRRALSAREHGGRGIFLDREVRDAESLYWGCEDNVYNVIYFLDFYEIELYRKVHSEYKGV